MIAAQCFEKKLAWQDGGNAESPCLIRITPSLWSE